MYRNRAQLSVSKNPAISQESKQFELNRIGNNPDEVI